jgi:hypothetical protein
MTDKPVSDGSTTSEVPDGGPWMSIRFSPDADMTIQGNAAGLERLATILLRCSKETADANEYRSCGNAARELQELMVPGSEARLRAIELLTIPPEPHHRLPSGVRDAIWLWGCGVAVFVVVSLCLMGLGVVTGVIGSR